jgi:hypothetical protein
VTSRNKRLIVTGSSALIGSAVIRRLAAYDDFSGEPSPRYDLNLLDTRGAGWAAVG